MRIDQLKYLITINESNSMSDASQKLHLTPQALSISLKNLEQDLGLILLDRSFRGAKLTECGKELVDITEQFLSQLHALRKKSKKDLYSNLSGETDLFTTYGEFNFFFPKIISNLYNDAPQLSINLRKDTFDSLVKKVLSDELEFAFVYQCTISGQEIYPIDSELVFLPLFSSHLTYQGSTKFPMGTKKVVSIQDILEHPIVVYQNLNDDNNFFTNILLHYGQPKQIISQKNYNIYQEMIASGLGVTLTINQPLKSLNINSQSNVHTASIKEKIDVQFGFIRKKDSTLSHKNISLISYIFDYFEEENR